MDTKTLRRVEIKDADKGEVTAVFATLGVIDLDGDVTPPGAFENGAKVRVSAYGHASWGGALPVGKGTIREEGNEAIAELQFFMDTTSGRDTFTVVKELGELGEWSYGYDPVEYAFGEQDGRRVRFLQKLKVHEVSPVLLGAAGPGNTRTIGAKSAQRFEDECAQVLAAHTALVDRAAEVMAMRQEKGKGIGDRSAELLSQLKGQGDRLAGLLAGAPAPEFDTDALRLIAAKRRIHIV